MIYISGPGHGGPAVVRQHLSRRHLQRDLSRISARMRPGLKKLFTQFSFPGGIPSHASPECPGSIHEGGELGYSLSHCVRRGVRQSRSDRGLRGRRRRGGNRAARDCVAFQQVPESRHRWRGAADPASQRLQDRQSDGARAHHPRGAGAAAARLRLDAVFRRGPRADADARGHGRDRSTRRSSRSARFSGRSAYSGNSASARAGR